MTDLNSGVVITAVVGPDTYEYVAAKALPFNKESRDWIYEVPFNTGVTPDVPKGYSAGGYEVQKPSVGRIVHYTHAALVGDNGEGFPEIDLVTHAAMILTVGEGYNAFLHIHPAMTRLKELGSVAEYRHNMVEPPLTRDHYDKGTPFSPTPKPGHWSWPPRV